MFIVTDDGVMVIDPMNTNHSQGMLGEIRKVTDAPITYLFYSHNHWDHTSGGQVWKDEGATIFAHNDVYEYLMANPHPDVLLPDYTWSYDNFQVTFVKNLVASSEKLHICTYCLVSGGIGGSNTAAKLFWSQSWQWDVNVCSTTI